MICVMIGPVLVCLYTVSGGLCQDRYVSVCVFLLQRLMIDDFCVRTDLSACVFTATSGDLCQDGSVLVQMWSQRGYKHSW